MAACQDAVSKASTKVEGEAHDETDPEKFVQIVLGLAKQTLADDGLFDGNMRLAAVMSMVLALWYARVNYAKAHDPNRPGLLRRRSYRKFLEWVSAMQMIPVSEANDSIYFPGQKWDFPYSFGTQDGDFK
jgi:hypothetical protein